MKQLGGNRPTTPTLQPPEQTALARLYTVNPALRALAAVVTALEHSTHSG